MFAQCYVKRRVTQQDGIDFFSGAHRLIKARNLTKVHREKGQ